MADLKDLGIWLTALLIMASVFLAMAEYTLVGYHADTNTITPLRFGTTAFRDENKYAGIPGDLNATTQDDNSWVAWIATTITSLPVIKETGQLFSWSAKMAGYLFNMLFGWEKIINYIFMMLGMTYDVSGGGADCNTAWTTGCVSMGLPIVLVLGFIEMYTLIMITATVIGAVKGLLAR